MLPFVAMKASTQSEAFRLVLTQGLQGPVSDVDAVFCNWDLPSISGGQPRNCDVSGVSWTTLTNNSKENFHAWS